MVILKGQKEVGTKYKSHFFSMFSQLFCTIAEEVITQFGNKGREAIVESVKKYGEERGRRVAKIVKSEGKELTLNNFFIYSDLDSGNINKVKLNIVDGNLEVIIRDCVYFTGCKEWEKLDYGSIYCDCIDISTLKGYNPDLTIEILSKLTKGDKRCVFRYIVKKGD